MRRFIRENSLSIGFGVIFLLCLFLQAYAGWHEFNDRQIAAQLPTSSWGRYVVSADFAVDVAENWQSEFLQFWLYLSATVWLLQKGSPESKKLDDIGRESEQDQKIGRFADQDSPRWASVGGWRTALYSNSLGIVMGLIFFACWLVQSVAGWAAYNETRLHDLQTPISWHAYLASSDFWNRTLQNWQSEFLAIGAMAVFSIYLRQRGSSQSKPVGAAHSATSIEG